MTCLTTAANRVLTRLADTLDEPAVWREVLDEIKQAVSAPHMLIAERDARGTLILGERPWEQPFISGYDGERGAQPYVDYFRQFDTWDRFEAGGRCAGPVLVSQAPGHAVPETSEFRDWLRPLDIDENAYMKLFDTPDGWVGLNIHFPARMADTDRMLQFLRLIRRPLARHARAALSGVRGCPRDGLERRIAAATHPQFLLAPDGRIKAGNDAAAEMAADNPGLLRRNGVLAFTGAELNARFHAAIAAVAATSVPEILAVPWPGGRGMAEVMLTPERGESDAFHTARTRVLVTFVTEGGEAAPLIAPLARAHGLNATETAILREAETGRDNRGIARALCLSEVHVRKTLSEIYAKLGVANRHELAALMARMHRAGM
jgi:DNA-binding CsgD family transcriptional regulator